MKKAGLTILEITLFALMGALMFASKFAMQHLPNVHLICVFIICLTVVFRWKALVSIYLYVLLEGLVFGFTFYWVSYLYVWLPPFFLSFLVPQKWPKWGRALAYAGIGFVSGITFGTLFAPMQAVFFGLNFKGMLAWIVSGLPYDAVHAVSNTILCGYLCVPLIDLLKYLRGKLRNGQAETL